MSNYEILYEASLGTYGIVTTTQAHELGVSDKELSRLTSAGKLERLGYCTYRVHHHASSRYDQYAIAVATVGGDAHLFGPSVLALLELCPTDPRRIHVATNKRVRHRLPRYVTLHKPSGGTISMLEGIASQTVSDAILSSRGMIMDSRLVDACHEARRRGLITELELNQIRGC